MANRTSGQDRRPVEEIRRTIENELRQGATVGEACKIAGRSVPWYQDQRARDREWAELIDRIRRGVKEMRHQNLPDFPEFCENYLGMKLWDHQLAMFDVLEGRPPRWFPAAFTYEPGAAGNRRILMNVPPNFAKSMTVTIAWTTWRLLKDPTLTVLIISKTQSFAAKLLYAIKQRLSHPRYADLQVAFGPVGGFKETAEVWSNTKIYLWGDQRDSQEKDPSVEAVGMGGQIYGNRAKLVIVDDAIVLSNAGAWEQQMEWLRQEVSSRIGPDDQIVVVGTRVDSVDLYRELANPDHYHDQRVPWTVFRMPAVLEYGPREEDWVTLWPRSDIPFTDDDVPGPDGLYDRWTGPRLARVRNEVGGRKWSMVYQQEDVAEDSIFSAVAIAGSMDRFRSAGQPLKFGTDGYPDEARWRPWIVVGTDPAIKGVAAFSVIAADRVSGHMWLLDIRGLKSPTLDQSAKMLMALADRYRANEIVVETNAYQLAIAQDRNLTSWCAQRGVLLKPHHTGVNKHDPLLGVASLSTMLGTTSQDGAHRIHNGDNILHLPNQSSPGMKVLVDEMVSWNPTTPVRRLKQDHLMSLWIAVYAARQVLLTANSKPFAVQNKFLSQHRRDSRMIVNLSDHRKDDDRVFL